MPYKNKKLYSTDLNTLNHLPVAVILFDNKKVYFLNSLAIKLFKVPKKYLNNFEQINIFNFLDKSYHKQIKENIKKILKGEDFQPLELKFKDFKNKLIFIEAKSNVVMLNDKEVVQSTFLEINNRIKEKTEAQEIKNLLEDTKQKFDLITKNGNDVISFYTYFPEEKYLFVSPNIKKVLGYEPKDLMKDCNFFNKRTEDLSGDFKKIDNFLKANQRKNIIKNHLYVYKTLNNKNEEVWIENNLAPILDKNGKIAFYLNVYRDITTQKEKEIEIELQKQNYQKLLEVTPTGYLIHKEGVCLYCNNALLKILKLKSYNQILGKFATDFVAEKDRKTILDLMKEVMLGVQINEPRTYLLLDLKKNEVEVEITSSTINYNNQLCIVSLINNISERKAQERQQLTIELTEKTNKLLQEEIKQRQEVQKTLLEKTAHLTSILDNSTHLIWTVNRKFEITSFNNNFNKIVRQRFKIKLNSGINIFEKITDKSTREKYQILWHTKYKQAFTGNTATFEIEVLDINFNKLYLEVFLNPILHNNEVVEVSGIAHDITDKKLSQQKIEQSLKEKEILLKEVHHRVKNNMQVISSILNLQSSYVNDEYALALLKESQNRIKTMAYIHESLYQNKSFTSVNFSEYIETLAKNIIQSYSITNEKIQLKLNLKKTILNLDTSIPAGLIVNELITNAIKHAFPTDKIGTIIINLATENNIVFLEVKDTGKGFEDIIDFKNSPSLGLQLVNTLIDQIDGDLDFESDVESGTRILITFKM